MIKINNNKDNDEKKMRNEKFINVKIKDITEGEEQDQGCCGYSFTAEEGWDPYTGLGTPNSFVLSQLALDSSFFHFPSNN